MNKLYFVIEDDSNPEDATLKGLFESADFSNDNVFDDVDEALDFAESSDDDCYVVEMCVGKVKRVAKAPQDVDVSLS